MKGWYFRVNDLTWREEHLIAHRIKARVERNSNWELIIDDPRFGVWMNKRHKDPNEVLFWMFTKED